MNATTLKKIKDDIRSFSSVVNALCACFDVFTGLKVIKIVIHNMAFDGSDCANHNHDDDVEKLYIGLNLLKSMANYHSDFEKYIYKEVEMIIQGNEMVEFSEMLDNNN